ncbi:MAG: response regulator transcription factor [Elusimicrobia bacterium]|nr:response regulator transcription factor [Elusimicrobiota bacterium]
MPKILIVDDAEDFRLVLSYILGQAGYEVAQAVDGAEALEMIAKEPPELAIVDWNMPKMNGLELCQAVRQNPAVSRLPIIMLTVRRQDTDHAEGIHHGADLYLSKPIEPDQILAHVKSLLRQKIE